MQRECKYCGRLTFNSCCKKCTHTNKKSLRARIFKNEYDFNLTFTNLRKLYKIHKFYKYNYNYNTIKYLKFHIDKNYKEIINIFQQIEKLGKDSGSLKSLIIRFGEEEGTKRYEKKKTDCAITLDTYIHKYGLKEGSKEYEDYCKKKTSGFRTYYKENGTFKSNKKGFIQKYGLKEGTEKYNAKCNNNKKSSKRCIDYWLNNGYTDEEAKLKVKEYQSFGKKENYIKRYGKIIGLIRWCKRQLKWQKTLAEKPQDEIDSINIKKGISLNTLIEKYGHEIGTKRYKKFILSCKNRSLKGIGTKEWYIKKYGYTGLIKYKDRNTRKGSSRASKESLNVFVPIYEKYSKTFNINIGLDENNEYFIWDTLLKRTFWYDFTIPELKIIIEYNGETFHPNPKWNKEKWDNWINPFTKETADKKHSFDRYKIDLAIKKGFKVLELWSSDDIETNIKYIEEFISSSI